MSKNKVDIDAFDLVERKALANRVVAGSQLASSPKLQSFFLYVVDCAIRDRPEEATEQQIGVNVFGRKPGYSSGDDSIVRSQARLLRLKLSSYFLTDGADEPLVIEIPKGQYLPIFRDKESSNPISSSEAAGLLEEEMLSSAEVSTKSGTQITPHKPLFSRGKPPIWIYLTFLAAVFGMMAGIWGYQRWTLTKTPGRDAIWAPLMTPAKTTLVIFSNPLFNGNPITGLRLANPETTAADPEQDDETYTGTGEVAAIYRLTRFFDDRDARFILKRSRLVTWDEARSSNLIFVGASSQNTALHDVPTLSEFAIDLDEKGIGYIVNQHPRSGEPIRFPRQDRGQETAIMALLPGLEPGTHILLFSGLTTVGTQAAVEYACRPENIARLVQQAGTTNGEANPFEAVLRVGISKGVAVNSQLLLLHRRPELHG
jgi:hypothetical protein